MPQIVKEEFTYKMNNIILLINKNSIVSYIDISLRPEHENIKQAVFNKYNKELVIYDTSLGFIIPKQFLFKDHGIVTTRKISEDKTETITISNKWIYVTSKVYSKYHNLYQYEVTSYNPVTRKSVMALCPASTLGKYSHCVGFCLDNLNIVTTENYKKELLDYFNKFMLLNDNKMFAKQTIPHMGWNDNCTEFMPYSKNLYFDFTGDNSNYLRNTYDSFKKNGNKDKFISKLKEFTQNNIDAEFMIGSSFAAPLLQPLALRSFALNFYGDSGNFKSLTCKFALSIWGNPNKLFSSGNHTKNVLIEKLSKFYNLPFYIDEITPEAFDIYSTGNESGRQRLDQHGNIKEFVTWRTVLFSTSEISMDSDDKKEGENNRYLSIKVNCVPENLKNKKEYARKMYSFISNNYGLLGEDFIKHVIAYKTDIDNYYEKIYNSIEDPEMNTEHLSMIATSYLGVYIYRLVFYNINDINYAISQAKKISQRLQSKKELDPKIKMYQSILEFYQINKNAFMHDHTPQKTNYCYGLIKNNKIIFFLTPLRDHLQKNGFAWNEKRQLIESGMIEYKNFRVNKEVSKKIIIDLDDNYNDIEREAIVNES